MFHANFRVNNTLIVNEVMNTHFDYSADIDLCLRFPCHSLLYQSKPDSSVITIYKWEECFWFGFKHLRDVCCPWTLNMKWIIQIIIHLCNIVTSAWADIHFPLYLNIFKYQILEYRGVISIFTCGAVHGLCRWFLTRFHNSDEIMT